MLGAVVPVCAAAAQPRSCIMKSRAKCKLLHSCVCGGLGLVSQATPQQTLRWDRALTEWPHLYAQLCMQPSPDQHLSW